METEQEARRVVSASREIAAAPEQIFELIADPARQPQWDGNDNLAEAAAGQRVRDVGDVFTMTLTSGAIRENHVVEFDEGRRIAWTPAEPGSPPPGHLWRWELEPAGASRTLVTCTYDWTRLSDKKRLATARATTAERLRASLDRLAALAEQGANVALRSHWEVFHGDGERPVHRRRRRCGDRVLHPVPGFHGDHASRPGLRDAVTRRPAPGTERARRRTRGRPGDARRHDAAARRLEPLLRRG